MGLKVLREEGPGAGGGEGGGLRLLPLNHSWGVGLRVKDVPLVRTRSQGVKGDSESIPRRAALLNSSFCLPPQLQCGGGEERERRGE